MTDWFFVQFQDNPPVHKELDINLGLIQTTWFQFICSVKSFGEKNKLVFQRFRKKTANKFVYRSSLHEVMNQQFLVQFFYCVFLGQTLGFGLNFIGSFSHLFPMVFVESYFACLIVFPVCNSCVHVVLKLHMV